MDLKNVKKVIKLLKDNDLQEIEVEEGGAKVRVVRAGGQAAPAQAAVQPSVPQVEALKEEKEVESKYKLIKSPMVGTFYRSASPETPPYVEKGETITKGQTLCIVEAMKLMNEIEAEFKGKIMSVLVENGQPVEYGEPLFEIDPL